MSTTSVTIATQFVFFDCFDQDLARGVHNLNSDTTKIYLSNDAPLVATDTTKTDVVEIATGVGYSGATSISGAASQSAGTLTFSGTGFTITWSGTSPSFRYLVLYNDTSASKALIGYWDLSGSIIQTNGETLPITLGTIFTYKTRG